MSGPKHLWSGNWEDDSARAAQDRSVQPLQFTEPEPVPEPPEEAPQRPRRNGRRYAWAAAASILVITAVVLAATLGGSSKPKHHARTTSTVSPPATTVPGVTGGAPVQSAPVTGNGPTANWLGMQLVTVPGGVAINSLRLGSPADLAGFEPGDVIDEINGQQISGVPAIAAATAKIPLGHGVQIQVLRSSVFVVLSDVPMTQRPAIHP
jgi:membrane-associated protease RseP (regulator of RpoE activity)